MNIEKLAIERKAFEGVIESLLPNNSSMYDPLAKYTTDEFNGQYVDGDVQKAWVKFQAYANSLQSSEPVAWVCDTGVKPLFVYVKDCGGIESMNNIIEGYKEMGLLGYLLYTHPPASVSLEKNKLLDAVGNLLEWDMSRQYIIPYKVRDPIIQAIAEAELSK